MKKILSLLALLCLCTVSVHAQLNVTASSSSEDTISRDMYCSVRGNSEGSYSLITSDKLQGTNATLELFLGTDRDGALRTLNDLLTWYEAAKNKSSVVVADVKTGEELTLYRVSKGTYLITNGDAEYARRTYNQNLTGSIAGGVRPNHNAASPIVGYVTAKVLRGAIEKLSE